MKKIIASAALTACAAVVTAQTVTSANIVGYSKTTLDAGAIDIVALQFSGTGEGVALGDAFDGLTAYESVIYRYNGSGYDVFDYYGEYGWYQGSTPSDDVVISQGEGIWLKGSAAGNTAMQSGEVPSTNSISVAVGAGIDIVANPYPVAVALGDLSGSALVGYDTVLYVYNGSGYDAYDYYGSYGWYNGSSPSDTVEIPVGVGFWLKSTAGGTLDFTKTY